MRPLRYLFHGLIVGAAIAASSAPAIASSVMRSQRLQPPVEASPGALAYWNPVVSGSWIAVFGRIDSSAGGGRVYIFHNSAGTWSLAQTLLPADGDACMDALAFSQNQLFAGCVNAPNPNPGGEAGAVTVFAENSGIWQQVETLYSSTGSGGGGFGASIAVANDYLYVGNPGYVSASSDVAIGDVEIYDVSGVPAQFDRQLLSPDPQALSRFGSSVAATGTQLAVGADSQAAAGIGDAVGAVYTFAHMGSVWLTGPVVMSPTPYALDNFPGSLVAVDDLIIAGSPNTDRSGKGGGVGAAYAYAGPLGDYAFQGSVSSPNGECGTLFGQAIAVVGGAVFVGEPIGGDGGKVHIYSLEGRAWVHHSAFIAAAMQEFDGLGISLSSDGQTLVVAATEQDRIPQSSGSIYVFDNLPTDQIFAEGMEP